MKIYKHFDYLTPFSEAENDRELEEIMRLKYPKACSNLETDASFFSSMVQDIQKYKAWRVIGSATFGDFRRDKLGKTIEEVESIVAGVKILQSRGVQKITAKAAIEAAPGTVDRGSRLVYDVHQLPKGNSRERLAARLKKLNDPDINRRIEAGEFKSTHAAGVAAGIVKIKTPLEQLNHWWKKASAAERDAFLEKVLAE